MNTDDIFTKVGDYDSFLTLDELDKRAFELSNKYGFEIREAGKSENNHPMYIIKAGRGSKNAFIWGFPHPNEPIGSLTIDWLIDYFGKNSDALRETDYTWYFMYTADPDGTRLNEEWFKGKLTLEKYFNNFYRPPANRMIDWTFPIKYKDYEWSSPLKETRVLMDIIDEIKPALMYPTHNSGFGGAYFFSTRKFDDGYYNNLKKFTQTLGIPLHMGEPEEEFMREIVKPFYFDLGCADYYEQMKKIGKNPLEHLKSGDNSTFYLLSKNPQAVVIKSEVPYFFSKKVMDTSLSSKTRRDMYLSFLENYENNLKFIQPILAKTLNVLKEPNPWFYLMADEKRRWDTRTDAMKNYVSSSPNFDRKATEAELADGLLGSYFYNGGLLFGQVKRALLEAGLNGTDIKAMDDKVRECCEKISSYTTWEVLPIKKLVQLQLCVLFETVNSISK
ncbi:MAG: M14 family zinc carboxypeptidase [Nanoarchaeota archaeon]|nr:M14 family zinc carboxypeptidase [Nanoarchaeota archaeon]